MVYNIPCTIIALATFINPGIFAPFSPHRLAPTIYLHPILRHIHKFDLDVYS